ncbi:MAG: hypothetical protein DMF61_24075 [Blastocatellia bacterium AA13]|nr:MAG: hypothetical protein DMF61_24075 [Blastocatellia bacterium AA13]
MRRDGPPPAPLDSTAPDSSTTRELYWLRRSNIKCERPIRRDGSDITIQLEATSNAAHHPARAWPSEIS